VGRRGKDFGRLSLVEHRSTAPVGGNGGVHPGGGRPRTRKGRNPEEDETFFRDLVEKVPAVVYVDASDEINSAIYMSPRAEEMLGYAPEEWTAVPDLWARILHPQDRLRVLSEASRARGTGESFVMEYRLMARDGRVVWVRDEAAPAGDVGGGGGVWRGVMLDVTERKRAEEELRKSEERFRLVARATGEAIWDNDLLADAQEWDGAVEEAFGYPKERIEGAKVWWEERVHPEDRGRVLAGLEAALRPGGGEAWSDEYRFRRADGSYAYVADHGFVVRDEATGRAVRMVGSMRDETASLRQAEELREAEERYRTTFERAPVGLARVAPDGRWLLINERLCELSGYRRDELLRLTYLDLTPPDDLQEGLDRVDKLLRGEIGPYTVERRYVRKDGSRVWVRLSVSLVRKASGEPDYLACTAEDITARKLEELLPEPLTCGELEVLRLVAAGWTNRQIAEQLSYSMGGIKHQVQRIIAKFKAKDRGEAASRAVDIGLIPPAP
jgi:PAS domain S-box-containing protein